MQLSFAVFRSLSQHLCHGSSQSPWRSSDCHRGFCWWGEVGQFETQVARVRRVSHSGFKINCPGADQLLDLAVKGCIPSVVPTRIASSSVLPSVSPFSTYSRVRRIDFKIEG